MRIMSVIEKELDKQCWSVYYEAEDYGHDVAEIIRSGLSLTTLLNAFVIRQLLTYTHTEIQHRR